MVPAKIHRQFKDDQLLGKVIGGKYAIFSVLGMGGFGAVYRAVQEPVGRQVAIKVVHSKYAQDPELRVRFFREARIVAQLEDPAVVTLYDYGEEDPFGLYMVFELVAGRTLSQLVKERPCDPIWTTHVVLQVLRALAEAHERGMIHRDIKPANIMVVSGPGGETRVRLLDFGIAKMLANEDGNTLTDHNTQRGLVIGTPKYMSPEQARARGEVDSRSDIYSLGVLAYAMLAGHNPFERESTVETIVAHCQHNPPPFDPMLGVPEALESAVLRALAKAPGERFQSANEMAETLRRAFPNALFPTGAYEILSDRARSMLSSSPLYAEVNAAVSDANTPNPMSETWQESAALEEAMRLRSTSGVLSLIGLLVLVIGVGIVLGVGWAYISRPSNATVTTNMRATIIEVPASEIIASDPSGEVTPPSDASPKPGEPAADVPEVAPEIVDEKSPEAPHAVEPAESEAAGMETAPVEEVVPPVVERSSPPSKPERVEPARTRPPAREEGAKPKTIEVPEF